MVNPAKTRIGESSNSKLRARTSTRNRMCVAALLPVALMFTARKELKAQTRLPDTPVTQTIPATRTPARTVPHHMQVLYAAGVLTIHAENSSLNGILREIARQTGMSITGGVAEERVYGNYGPADTGTVLATLLAGTGSNLLLEESTADRPLTLVLTPRQGGPTPPNPANTPPDQDEGNTQADLPPEQTRPTPPAGPLPSQTQPAPGFTPPVQPSASTASDPAANTTNQESPNGVKTPQQIYDQLIKLKQQQTAAPPQ